MSKDNKRFRQISLAESFSFCKKTKNNSETPTMEQNLRNLMAAAAEKRIALNQEKQTDRQSSVIPHISQKKDIQDPSTSNLVFEKNSQEEEDSGDLFVPSSQELFPNSEELFPTGSIEEVPPTPENNLNGYEAVSDFCQSAEIFSEGMGNESQSSAENETDTENEQVSFLNRIPDCRLPLPKLKPLENHSIMFSPHIRPGDAPRPYPSSYRDMWDSTHVRMPCSPLNRYPVESLDGEKLIKSRWDLICRSLRRNIETSQQLEEAIMQYNSQYRGKWNFHGLHAFFEQHLSNEEQVHFFETILPVMIEMALDLPKICTQPPPLLKKDKDHYLTLSQKQIGCLLLNAFFCTFPRRNGYTKYHRRDTFISEYSTYPDINFNRLFFGVKNRISPSNAEKLKCLLNYFRRITTEVPSGTVTFHRQYLKNLPTWENSAKGLKTVIVKSRGLIETEGYGMLQVDFANKFVGGGVLGQGCVQEEIRFVICPELIVSRLFVECLGATEVLIITGVEQYNKYSGYSNSFKWEGNFVDPTPRDEWGRKCTKLVAMNATFFRNTNEQFKPFRIARELNKAYCGFYEKASPANLSAIATGNWGCGAFRGDPIVKFIIQLMASSQASRDMLYFTFNNNKLKEELKIIYNIFSENNLSVGDLWRILMKYSNEVKILKDELYPSLIEFINSFFVDDSYYDETAHLNSQSSEISNSEQLASVKLIEDVDNSETEIEDNDTVMNDPG